MGGTHQPAGVAQLVEQLIRNQQVRGSSPRAGSNEINILQRHKDEWPRRSYHIATTQKQTRLLAVRSVPAREQRLNHP